MTVAGGENLVTQRLGLGRRPALVVVDMTRGFTDPACALGCACDAAVAANASLLAAFRSLGLPIFFTAVVYHNASQARVFRQRLPALNLLTPGSPWVALDPRLDRHPEDELIEKQWASAFHRTDLDTRLRSRDVDSLVVTGLTTSGCVRATAVDGLQYDYRVVVPREAVADRNPSAHEANLLDLAAKYADVDSLAAVLGALRSLDRAV